MINLFINDAVKDNAVLISSKDNRIYFMIGIDDNYVATLVSDYYNGDLLFEVNSDYYQKMYDFLQTVGQRSP
jgi:hypothetical protein